MATGLEMYDALLRVIAARGNGTVAVNEFDAEDLTRLTAADLRLRDIDAARSERIASELAEGNLRELGNVVGAHLTIERHEPNLISGEGIRRSAGSLADEEQTMEEMFEELDRIRHPERYNHTRRREMHQTVEAIYDDGVLRPLEKLSLRPNQRVLLRIDEAPDAAVEIEDKAFLTYCRSEGDPNITLEEVRQALAVIPGSLTDACSAERDER